MHLAIILSVSELCLCETSPPLFEDEPSLYLAVDVLMLSQIFIEHVAHRCGDYLGLFHRGELFQGDVQEFLRVVHVKSQQADRIGLLIDDGPAIDAQRFEPCLGIVVYGPHTFIDLIAFSLSGSVFRPHNMAEYPLQLAAGNRKAGQRVVKRKARGKVTQCDQGA